MKIIYIIINIIIGFLVFCLSSCKDDIDLSKGPADSGITDAAFDGYSIGFTVKLDLDMSTRAEASSVEAYENYIDTQNKFRVLFFNQYGDFLFGAIDRTITDLGNDGTSSNWYVRVPMNYLVDRNNNEYDAVAIREYLRNHPFKVAILANWPNEDAEGNSSYEKREPNWGWGESVMNPEAVSAKKVKNINDLHHLKYDTYYSDTSNSSGRPSRWESYDFLMSDDQKAGVNYQWVQMRNKDFSSKNDADSWIRNNWDPYSDYLAKTYPNSYKPNWRHYVNLWQLWDFNASCKQSGNTYNYDQTWSGVSNKWGKEWYDRNGSKLKNWLGTSGSKYLNSAQDIDDLHFEPTTDATWFSNNYCYTYHSGSNHGIVLQPAEQLDKYDNGTQYINPTKSGSESRGYLSFEAPGSGTYRIKCGSASGTSTIVVQRGTNPEYYYSVSTSGPTDFLFDTEKNVTYKDQSITEDAEPIYIWCQSGSAIIYAIEWICNQYLSDTDREGIAPSPEHPIPMYGVQQFTALSDWKEGTTKDISAKDPEVATSETKYISLVRCVAKVEVYLPQEARHIYMRSMNRKSRCEPMDVETSTADLWKDHKKNSDKTKHCEWYNIQEYGSWYLDGSSGHEYPGSKKNPSDKTELKTYTNMLSWYYWSWKSASWNVTYDNQGNKTNSSGWDFEAHNQGNVAKETVSNPKSSLPSPHLFNPDIERSDFCHFLDAGESQGYYKYVLYVPDKNITDPNNQATPSSTPKVARIEYRYKDINSDYLDDNSCYRLYFTNYGTDENYGPANSVISTVQNTDYESSSGYEKADNLDKHWPIMRNHVYQFYVGGSGSYQQAVRVQVSEWGYDKITVDW